MGSADAPEKISHRAINDNLKNVSQIEHSRHRSLTGFMVNLVGGLIAYVSAEKAVVGLVARRIGAASGGVALSRIQVLAACSSSYHSRGIAPGWLKEYFLIAAPPRDISKRNPSGQDDHVLHTMIADLVCTPLCRCNDLRQGEISGTECHVGAELNLTSLMQRPA
jgi:hypothetical protein